MQYYKNYQWIQAYNSQSFNEAEKYFSGSILYWESEIIYFNQWNNFYKQAQQEKNINKKLELLQKSIEKYSQALEYKNRDFIENNYKIAQQELNKYKQIEEKNKDIASKEEWEENTQENVQQNQDGESNSNQDSQESWDEQNQQWESLQDQQWGNQYELTQQQQAELEKYLQELKEIEANNQKFFNKQPQNKDFFQKFSNDPFLQNEFNRWGEKDW